MCGLTEAEIIKHFPDYLEETANEMQITSEELIEKMRYYYNGFSFDSKAETRLYNPYSTLTFFEKKEFLNHWIDTGSSKFIADYLKNKHLTVEQFRNLPISVDFAQYPGNVDTTPPEGFLYQSGYLTLRPGTTNDLSLDYPNTEVLNSMSKLLIQNIVTDNAYNNFQNDLFSALFHKNIEKIVEVFNRLLALIPYDDFASAAKQSISINNFKIQPQEWLYRSSILAFLHGCGIVVIPEIHTNLGRSDLMVKHKGRVFVLELKVAYEGQIPAQKLEEALGQIIEKNYAASDPETVCIAMVIDDKVRQITEWKVDIHRVTGASSNI